MGILCSWQTHLLDEFSWFSNCEALISIFTDQWLTISLERERQSFSSSNHYFHHHSHELLILSVIRTQNLWLMPMTTKPILRVKFFTLVTAVNLKPCWIHFLLKKPQFSAKFFPLFWNYDHAKKPINRVVKIVTTKW